MNIRRSFHLLIPAILLVAAFAGSCSSDPPVTPVDPDDSGRTAVTVERLRSTTWNLVEIERNAVPVLPPEGKTFSLIFNNFNAVGTANCYEYSFNYELGGVGTDVIPPDSPAVRLRFDNRTPESHSACTFEEFTETYMVSLAQAQSAVMEDSLLVITFSDGLQGRDRLVFRPAGQVDPRLVDIRYLTWRLEKFESAVEGESIIVPDDQIFTVTLRETSLGGTADCNQYYADYTTGPGNSLTVGSIGGTRGGCPSGSLDALFYDALGTAVSYEVTSSSLRIRYGDGSKTMVFTQDFAAVPVILRNRSLIDTRVRKDYSLLGAKADGDLLAVYVTYIGGSHLHGWEPLAWDQFEPGSPPKTRLYLLHSNRSDHGSRVINHTLYIDLAPLRQLYKEAYGSEHGSMEITLDPLAEGSSEISWVYAF